MVVTKGVKSHTSTQFTLLGMLQPNYASFTLARCGNDAKPTKASITLRYPRNPVVGDKFSSRHGQKGVLSMLWPECDMPFTELGVSPDVIINPHACVDMAITIFKYYVTHRFPSRMTIGMLIESMAGKSCALDGRHFDSTPFTFNDKNQKAVNFIAEQLAGAGYAYYGSEPVYYRIVKTATLCAKPHDIGIFGDCWFAAKI